MCKRFVEVLAILRGRNFCKGFEVARSVNGGGLEGLGENGGGLEGLNEDFERTHW